MTLQVLRVTLVTLEKSFPYPPLPCLASLQTLREDLPFVVKITSKGSKTSSALRYVCDWTLNI